MLPTEAKWIGEVLGKIESAALSPVLELGSSTPDFRRHQQPYIYELIDRPLAERGIKFIHCDSKADVGIDISGNIFDRDVQAKMRAIAPRCILCCNIFEHVTDRRAFAAICDSLLEPLAYLLVTVPRSYPLHPDPIDTYFRPTPAGIHALFPGYELLESAVVCGASYGSQLMSKPAALPRTLWSIVKNLLRPRRSREWLVLNHRLLWTCRRYKVSAALMRKRP